MCKQNLGKLDRVLRFLLGFWWLGPFAPQYGGAVLPWLVLIVGWISLVESLTAYCPLHNLFGINNKMQ
ncbi:MAG: DUF2892 domain-containing protein [Nanoarchaeota archaeon]